jgi:serine/threonine protein kinase
MRFVHGATLAGTPRTSPRAGLRLCLRLCETVAHAHALGVVHLDLKPENVMLGPLGELYVMDWGLARALDAPAGGRAGGTPGYMAPEQEEPGPSAPDARADVYALGGLVAFLAGGSPPAPAGTLALDGLPRPLAAIVARCRVRDPAGRYPSAQELARDLAAYLDEEPVAAYRENLVERAGRFLRRHQFVVWLVIGYLILRALVVFLTGR